MASPPYGGSPPAASPLALPRQRPTLALPTGNKSRKPSIVSATSSAHPLRQTSFPPPELTLEQQHAIAEDNELNKYSPSLEGSFHDHEDEFSDDEELKSMVSGPASSEMGAMGPGAMGGKKRKRGEKRPRGRPAKGGRGGSLINGDDGRSTVTSNKRGVTVEAPEDHADDDDDDDDDAAGAGGGRVPLYEGGQMSQEQRDAELVRRNVFYESVPLSHQARYDSYNRAKLQRSDVRKLINATLSQSVPANVVLVVSAYAKMFAGGLIEDARQVQKEWEAASLKRADGEINYAQKRIKRTHELKTERVEVETAQPKDEAHTNGAASNTTTNGNGVKPEPKSPANGRDVNMKEASDDVPPLEPGGAGGLGRDIHEYDRGPLLPDHLREALRRYKKRRASGSVGFTGLSLEGRENTAPRMGGRRLFR